MVPKTEALALIIVAAICAIGVIILGAIKVPVPPVLGDLAFAAVGAGAGAAMPTRNPPTGP